MAHTEIYQEAHKPANTFEVFRSSARQLVQHFFDPSYVVNVFDVRETLRDILCNICPDIIVDDGVLGSILQPGPDDGALHYPADIFVNFFVFCATQWSGKEKPLRHPQHTSSDMDEPEPLYTTSGSQETIERSGHVYSRRSGKFILLSIVHIFVNLIMYTICCNQNLLDVSTGSNNCF